MSRMFEDLIAYAKLFGIKVNLQSEPMLFIKNTCEELESQNYEDEV